MMMVMIMTAVERGNISRILNGEPRAWLSSTMIRRGPGRRQAATEAAVVGRPEGASIKAHCDPRPGIPHEAKHHDQGQSGRRVDVRVLDD